jgi:hypothetical protein
MCLLETGVETVMQHKMIKLFTDPARKTFLMDSISYVTPYNRGDIIISGSHGGTSSAGYAIEACVAAAFFNDAGVGKNEAGIMGLELLQHKNILAAAVSHESAEIANAADTYKNGIISHVNRLAQQAGIRPHMPVVEAVAILRLYFKPQAG